jgi:hypothetical protein
MSSLIVSDKPIRMCCATCSHWGLAKFYRHPFIAIKDNDPYCPMLGVSLKPYMGDRAIYVTCYYWRREVLETEAVELWESMA